MKKRKSSLHPLSLALKGLATHVSCPDVRVCSRLLLVPFIDRFSTPFSMSPSQLLNVSFLGLIPWILRWGQRTTSLGYCWSVICLHVFLCCMCMCNGFVYLCISLIRPSRSAKGRRNVYSQLSGVEDVVFNDFIKDDRIQEGDGQDASGSTSFLTLYPWKQRSRDSKESRMINTSSLLCGRWVWWRVWKRKRVLLTSLQSSISVRGSILPTLPSKSNLRFAEKLTPA